MVRNDHTLQGWPGLAEDTHVADALSTRRAWLSCTPRLRYVLLVAWGTCWFIPPNSFTLARINDWLPFEVGARTIVHYHHMWEFSTPALHLFADNPLLQFGPLPALMLAPFQVFSPHGVAIGFGLAMVVAGVAAMAALEAAARTLLPAAMHPRARRTAFAIELVLVPIWSYEVGYWHHLDDVLALLCLSLAALVIARQGPWWLFGVLAGTAAATKPWAVLGVPLFLAFPRPLWAKTALATLAAGAAWWLPFIVAAPQTVNALGNYHTSPSLGSPLYLVGVHADGAGWLRPLQMLAGMGVVALLARRGRWQDALFAGMAMRIVFDPFAYSYYAMGPLLGALLVDLSRIERRRMPRWTIATVLLVWLLPRLYTYVPLWGFTVSRVPLPSVSATARLVWALSVVAMLVAPHIKERAGWALRSRAARAATT